MGEINLIQRPVSIQDFQRNMRFGQKNHSGFLEKSQLWSYKVFWFIKINPCRARIEFASSYQCAHVPRISEKPLQKRKTQSFILKDWVLKEYSSKILLPTLVWIFKLIYTKRIESWSSRDRVLFFMDRVLFLKTRFLPLS